MNLISLVTPLVTGEVAIDVSTRRGYERGWRQGNMRVVAVSGTSLGTYVHYKC